MKGYFLWDKDAVLKVASIFDSIAEFREAYVGAYKYARRHGFLDLVHEVISPVTSDVSELRRRVTMELDSSRRHHLTASRARSVGSFGQEDETASDIQVGNYLDHDISHWEQGGEEREERALHWIAKVIEHGSEQDIAEVWEQFAEHQVHGRQGNEARRSRRGIITQRQGGK